MSKPTKRKPPSRRGKKVERKPGHLPPKKRRFVAEYLICNDAGEAARRAGSKAKNPHKVGYNWLQDPAVIAALEAERAKLASKLEITAERVLQGIASVAFGDLRALFDENGQLRPIKDLPAEVAACLAGVDIVTARRGEGEVEYIAKVKTNDRLRALELLGKNLGLFVEKVEHSGEVGPPVLNVIIHGKNDGTPSAQ